MHVTQCASQEFLSSIILRARNMCCLFHIVSITLTFQVKKDELTAPSGKSAVKLPEVLSLISILLLVSSHTYICFCCEEWWKKAKRSNYWWIRASEAKDKLHLALGVISVLFTQFSWSQSSSLPLDLSTILKWSSSPGTRTQRGAVRPKGRSRNLRHLQQVGPNRSTSYNTFLFCNKWVPPDQT